MINSITSIQFYTLTESCSFIFIINWMVEEDKFQSKVTVLNYWFDVMSRLCRPEKAPPTKLTNRNEHHPYLLNKRVSMQGIYKSNPLRRRDNVLKSCLLFPTSNTISPHKYRK